MFDLIMRLNQEATIRTTSTLLFVFFIASVLSVWFGTINNSYIAGLIVLIGSWFILWRLCCRAAASMGIMSERHSVDSNNSRSLPTNNSEHTFDEQGFSHRRPIRNLRRFEQYRYMRKKNKLHHKRRLKIHRDEIT